MVCAALFFYLTKIYSKAPAPDFYDYLSELKVLRINPPLTTEEEILFLPWNLEWADCRLPINSTLDSRTKHVHVLLTVCGAALFCVWNYCKTKLWADKHLTGFILPHRSSRNCTSIRQFCLFFSHVHIMWCREQSTWSRLQFSSSQSCSTSAYPTPLCYYYYNLRTRFWLPVCNAGQIFP